MIKLALDFAPGLHGHFLEYVCNRYIFKVPYEKNTVFQSTGACHTINTDSEYQKNKVVRCGHYSSFGNQFSKEISHILFIKHDPALDIILLTNIFYRCHPGSSNVEDFNIKEIIELHTSLMSKSTDSIELKNDWYNKLMERHFEYTTKLPTSELPVFYFDYSSFFELDRFLLEIKKTADFFEHTFSYDESLATLWFEFINRNQGYHLYQQGNQLFNQIVSDVDNHIPDDWKIHAYLNYKLSTIFGVHSALELFGTESYPTTTKQVYQVIKNHIDNFDNLY